MQDLLEIRVLGPFEVLAGGTPADVGGSKRQALLAMLALRHGRVVASTRSSTACGARSFRPLRGTRSTITSPGCAPRSERTSIVGSADGYALQRRARRCGAVRGAARGDARARCATATSPAAADAVGVGAGALARAGAAGLTGTAWFGAEARRLETLRVDALEERLRGRLALGEHRELAPALRSALADNPFRERLWGQLMLALYRSGRQADALETFQEARRVLADELGLEPGPELRRLQEAILAHDPAIAAVPVDRRRRGNLPAPSTSFVGREDELARGRRAPARAPPRDADRARRAWARAGSRSRRRARSRTSFPDGVWLVDFARAGGAADAVRLLAHAVDVRGSDPLARVSVAASRARRRSSSSTRASTSSTRRRGSRRRSSRSARACGSWRRAARRSTSPSEVRFPVAPLGAARPSTSSSSARGRRDPASSRTREAVALAAEIVAARRRPAARDRARRCARERARARGARLDPRAPRGAPARQPGIRPGPHRAAGARRMELRPPARRREDAAPAARRPPRRRVAALARRGRSDARPQRGDRRLPRRGARRQVDRVGLVLRRRRPLRHARHASASTCSSVSPRAAGSPPPAAPTPSTSPRSPRRRAVGLRGPEWLRWQRRLELENDNFWAALAYAREAPDPAVAVRLGTLGWYFALAERVSEGRRFLELALSASRRRRAGRAADRAARRPLLPRDRRARSRRCARGRRARARARRDRRGAAAAAASRN